MLKSRYKIKQIFLEPVYLCLCTGAYKLYTQTVKLPHPSVQYSTVLHSTYLGIFCMYSIMHFFLLINTGGTFQNYVIILCLTYSSNIFLLLLSLHQLLQYVCCMYIVHYTQRRRPPFRIDAFVYIYIYTHVCVCDSLCVRVYARIRNLN